MEKRQTVVLLLLVLMVIIGMVAAAIFLQGDDTADSGGIAKASQTRLQLTPSKPRQSLTITSKRPPAMKTTSRSGNGAATEEPAATPPPAMAARPSRPQKPGGEIVEKAMNAATPEQGIALLTSALEEEPPPIKAAQYLSAKAVLTAQQTLPDLAASQAAFEEALRIAPDLATEQSVRLQQAQLLLQQDAQDRAMAVIQAALAQQGAPVQETLDLYLLQGTLLEGDDAAQAEAAYAEALELARKLFPEAPALNSEMMQVAAFRLARLYRAQGREDAAEALSRKVKAYLEKCMAQKDPGDDLPPLLD